MARDCTIDLRRTLVETLKGDPAIAALVGEEVYGPRAKIDPTWPFIRVEIITSLPDFDGCSAEPSRCSFRLHSFAKGDDERNAAGLAKLAVKRIDGLDIALDDPPTAWLRDTLWTGTQVLGDTDEANGWHGVSDFDALVSADAE